MEKKSKSIILSKLTSAKILFKKIIIFLKKLNIRNIKKFFFFMQAYGINAAIDRIKHVTKPLFHSVNKNIYKLWIENNEPTSIELENQKKHKFKYSPKISIIVPMYKTSINYFNPLIDSIINQTYSNWELCLADGSPERNLEIENLIKKDSRIKYRFLNENKGISGNTNEALKMATGDFVALLDHDDILALFSLYEIVKCINENPDVEFIYTDEDNVDEYTSTRHSPHFKPDFAIDTLRAQNYICHFTIFKKELMDKLEGLRSKYDGSQDHDLVLRMSELTNNIVHIPKILYHWRTVESSFSKSCKTRSKTNTAGICAVSDHLNRLGLLSKVSSGNLPNSYEIQYNIIGNPKVSIIIPNKDMCSTLKACIDSILKLTTYNNYEIIIVENNSTSKKTFNYYKKLEQYNNIKILYYKEKGFNYSKIINFGVRNSSGEYIVQLNNDITLITPNWIEKMLGFAQREDVGVVGAKLYFPDMSIQHAGVIIGEFGAAHAFRTSPKGVSTYLETDNFIRNVSAVTGACMMSSKKIYEQVGYMNEAFEVNYNDTDFCLKVRNLNKLVVYNPFVELVHYESKTRKNDTKKLNEEEILFKRIWKDVLEKGDPYYNKNLSSSPNYCLNLEKPHSISVNNHLAIIIVNYNDYVVTKKYLDLIHNYKILEKIIVVDNNSTDNSFEALKELEDEKIDVIKTNKNIGYGLGNTFGLKYLEKKYNSKYKYVIISNPDIYVEEKIIYACLEELEKNTQLSIVAPRIYSSPLNPDKRSSWKQRTYLIDLVSSSLLFRLIFYPIYRKSLYSSKDYLKSKLEVDCMSGCFFLANINALKEVNYFDENIFLFYEEDILCRKLKDNNYKICSLNTASCIHYKSQTINKNIDFFKKKKLFNKSKLYYHKKYNNINSLQVMLLHLANGLRYLEAIPEYIIRKLVYIVRKN